MLYTGFYPRIHDKNLNPSDALSFYVSTYIERDIRRVLNVKDLSRFEIFLRLLAGRAGAVLNSSALASDCGLSHNTVRAWIGVLEQSSIVYLLKPFHANLGKRLLKSPKLYFLANPLRGQVFENFAVGELLKDRLNRAQKVNEVDIVAGNATMRRLIEVKSSATFHTDHLAGLDYLGKLLEGSPTKFLVLGNADRPYGFRDARVQGYPYLDGLADAQGPIAQSRIPPAES
jgi:predicted AAA+ superfamily ATPase